MNGILDLQRSIKISDLKFVFFPGIIPHAPGALIKRESENLEGMGEKWGAIWEGVVGYALVIGVGRYTLVIGVGRLYPHNWMGRLYPRNWCG